MDKFGDIYFGQLEMENINLGQPGLYEISFYVLMYCQGTQCNPGVDSIKVIINEKAIIPIVFTVDLNSIDQQKIWQKKTFRFDAPSSFIDVIIKIKYVLADNRLLGKN